jgi:hypothetical protein
MKQIAIALFSVALLSQAGFAQFKKGTRFLGANIGGISYSKSKATQDYPAPTVGLTDKTSSFGISFAPSYGIFISDNIAVGGNILVGFTKTTVDNYLEGASANYGSYSNDGTNFGLGAYIRYYFKTTSSLIPFIQASASGGSGSSKGDGSSNYSGPLRKETYTFKTSGQLNWNAGVTFGVTKMLNSHVGLDLGLGYTFYNSNYDYTRNARVDYVDPGTADETRETNYKLKSSTSGVSLSVGFQIFLDAKKK